jgi:endo-1,4-beta-mannosidase
MIDAFAGRFLLGVNYWSRAGGPRMWERFDEDVIRRELEQLRAVGLDCCRAFAFAPTFMPRPPAVDDGARERLRRFFALAGEAKVGVLMTALVGHMSGENWDFPGQGARSLYADEELLAWQRALVTALVEDGRASESVIAWVLSNEMPLWAGFGPRPEVTRWCETLVQAVRALDVARPIGTGDGAMTGFPTRAVVPVVDYAAPHNYYADADPLRQAWMTDLRVRALQPLGRPVVFEEFGASSTQAGEREQAAYYREVIAASLGAGARGAIGWCFSDFDAETVGREPPYSHHGFELGFGITRADGSEKPVCDELRAFRALLDGLDLSRVRAQAPRAAIVQPRYLDEDVPFSWQDRAAMARALTQAFVLASQAGLDPAVIGEDDTFDPYALLLVPSTQKLHTPTWLKLRDRARAGATVYWSYFSGDHDFHQASWCPIFGELTGLEHRLRYGCVDLPAERFVLKGDVALSVPTGVGHVPPWPLARLPIEPRAGAKVNALAVDGEGRLALTSHALGAGRVVFLAYPLERYLAALADGSSRDAHRLYRLLGEEAGVEPRYATHHVDVQSRVLEDGADDLVIVQHRGWKSSVDDATDVPRDAQVIFDRGSPSPGALGPKAVRIYRVRAR